MKAQPLSNKKDASPDSNALPFKVIPAIDNEIRSFVPEALGRLRRELFWMLGEERAHGVMARLGFSCGQADAFNPLADQTRIGDIGVLTRLPPTGADGDPIFEVKDSLEAKEHLRFYPSGTHSQCWMLAGYLTGLLSHQMGHPIYFLETQCVAKNQGRCVFIGKPRTAWAADESANLSPFDEDNLAYEVDNCMEQLRFTKDRYQNLFEQLSSPIFIIEPATGLYLNVNQAAETLTGYSTDHLIRMNMFDLYHPQEHQRLMMEMKDLVNSGRPQEGEVSIVRKDGLIRIIAQSNKILTYGGQHVIQCVMRDITDLKLSAQKEKDLQHQLLSSERLSSIGRLAAGVAHELKNPLGAIRNAVYYIRNALGTSPLLETDPHLKEILKLAESEVDGAVVIIGELLDFSRVVQLVPRRTQVNELLEKLPNIINVPENINLIFDLDMMLPSAIIDPDRLNQVFCNILANAIQAMPQGGQIKIKTQFVVESTREEEGNQEMVVVSIEDSGVGIEPVHLTKIFEPLFTTKARGTGLGLAISSNIVEKHGGVILVTSQVGRGTTFNVKLPMKPPAEKEENTHEQQ